MSDFFKKIAKEEGFSIMESGESSGEFTGFIDTGSYILNAMLSGSMYGGLPNNKILALAGDEATGKTFIALGMIKTFLDENKDGGAMIFETEGAYTDKMLKERGFDTSRIIMSEPEHVEDFKVRAVKFIDSYMAADEKPPVVMLLDSLGMLSSKKEIEDASAGDVKGDMGIRAKVIKGTFRTLTLKLAAAKIPLILTNHTYANPDSKSHDKEMGGGSGLKYSASQIIHLSKSKDQDDTTKEVYGVFITATAKKSRLTKENKKVQMYLSYEKGLDRYWGLHTIAVKYGIFTKLSKQLQMPDGTKVYEKALRKNPEKYYTPEVMERLEEACKKEFLYGVNEAPDEDDDMDEADAA